MNICKTAVVLLIVMGLAGCITPQDRGYVQREWSMSLRELGISPIFPPREDVMVGDIYASDYDPNDAEIRRIFETKWNKLEQGDQQKRLGLGMSPRLARLAPLFEAEILKEYNATVSAPSTTAEYNNILGNPALTAANDQVGAADAKLKILNDKVAAAKKEASDAQKEVSAATRVKQDKDTAVTTAQDKLTAAKAILPDTSAEERKLQEAKNNVRSAENEVTNAARALENAGDDPAKKEDAKKLQLQASRDKADADLAVKRAQEDLDAAKAAKVNVSSYESALASAKSEQQTAADNLTKLQRISDDKTAAATAAEQEQADPIAKAKKDKAAAEALRDAIATAGVKMLYAQPRDGKYNVFTAQPLPNKCVEDAVTVIDAEEAKCTAQAKDAKSAAGAKSTNCSAEAKSAKDAAKAKCADQAADDLVNSRVNRLRLVAFPEFATTTFTQGDLAALIPIEAIMVGLNISSTNVAKVSVKVPAAESYALSLDKVIPLIAEKKHLQAGAGAPVGAIVWTLKTKLKDAITAAEFQYYDKPKNNTDISKPTDEKIIYYCIATEVFYARALDITLFSANSFGARAQVGAPAPAAGAAALPTASSTPVAPVNSSAAASAPATDMLTNIQNRLAMTQNVPGGSIQVVSYSDQSIGLRRVFDRPIAIGSRGLVLAVKGDKVVGVSSEVSPVPRFIPP